jgi:putative hydrolase
MGDVNPVEALRETAFWLERERASSYRVEAFRKAAAALSGLSPEEVAERAGTGALARMKGLGPRTTTVVEQALADEVPAYLADLRERNTEPLAAEGAELRALLRGDLHSHSDWSDGGSPIEEMARAAVWRGREYQALTDHSPRLTIANGLSRERLEVQVEVVAELDSRLDGMTLLTGIEVDIHLDGSLDQDDDLLARLDVVVASVHSKLAMDAPSMTRRMLAAVSNPHTDVLGHCTGRLVEGGRGTRRQSQFDAGEVFRACADHGVAVEINSRPERQDPPDDLLDLANELGCLFAINTDAHAPGQLDFLDHGRIVTTWSLDRLRTWLTR